MRRAFPLTRKLSKFLVRVSAIFQKTDSKKNAKRSRHARFSYHMLSRAGVPNKLIYAVLMDFAPNDVVVITMNVGRV